MKKTILSNPIFWSDVPDVDCIRVKDTYYMVSTTMHVMPGCPIMKSKDLKNWEIQSYIYDIIEDNEANKYLNEIFIPKMNSKFSYEIDSERNDMRKNTYSQEELNIIISEQYIRKIDNSSAIKYKGNYYIPIDIETGEIMSFKQNTICTLIITYDYTYWCNIENSLYILSKIKTPEKKTYQKTEKTQEEINRSKAHKPAPNHPWRNYKKN